MAALRKNEMDEKYNMLNIQEKGWLASVYKLSVYSKIKYASDEERKFIIESYISSAREHPSDENMYKLYRTINDMIENFESSALYQSKKVVDAINGIGVSFILRKISIFKDTEESIDKQINQQVAYINEKINDFIIIADRIIDERLNLSSKITSEIKSILGAWL